MVSLFPRLQRKFAFTYPPPLSTRPTGRFLSPGLIGIRHSLFQLHLGNAWGGSDVAIGASWLTCMRSLLVDPKSLIAAQQSGPTTCGPDMSGPLFCCNGQPIASVIRNVRRV